MYACMNIGGLSYRLSINGLLVEHKHTVTYNPNKKTTNLTVTNSKFIQNSGERSIMTPSPVSYLGSIILASQYLFTVFYTPKTISITPFLYHISTFVLYPRKHCQYTHARNQSSTWQFGIVDRQSDMHGSLTAQLINFNSSAEFLNYSCMLQPLSQIKGIILPLCRGKQLISSVINQ